jgi:hypothetical protein
MGTDLLPFDQATSIVAMVSVLGFVLLLPLYISQRRDIERLREWMYAEPDFPERDVRLSEERLDKAEADLEQSYVDRGEPVPGTQEFQAVHPDMVIPETSERPALTQVTMERAALEPHPRWRSFRDRITQPLPLAIIAVVAIVLAGAAIVGVDEVLQSDDSGAPAESTVSGIEVAVLNTTPASGLAGRIATDVEDAGYLRGQVGNLERPTDQTLVMYQPDREKAAKRIAEDLLGGVAIQEIDREVDEASGEADVVVIIGQDRVGE